MLKAFKLVLDTCLQAVLLPSSREFSDVSVLEVISSMEVQTLNSALVNLLDSLTAKVHKLKELVILFLNISHLSMRRLEGMGERRLLFNLFVREPCHSSRPVQGGCSCERASSK